MKVLLILIAFLLSPLAENEPRSYVFTKQIKESFQKDSSNLVYFKSAWEYISIGEYLEAIKVIDQVLPKYGKLKENDIIEFKKYKPFSAKDYILKRAMGEKIIMINEAHHQPMHRVFTTTLLEGLYKRGYRYLGLEAINYQDSLLNDRGYPILETGYYTQEPQFGNLIREAIKIGYTIFPYESRGQADGKDREIQQAKNITQIVNQNPDAKFIIHCGHDHINESEVRGWEKAMAGRVKEFLSIDPFTINQEILTEHYFYEKENPYYHLADNINEATVFIDSLGNPFHGRSNDNRYDLRLFHPRTTFIDGRPNWLNVDDKKHVYLIPKDSITIDYPVIVKAYLIGESVDAVPIDVIEIEEFTDQKGLVLSEGEYLLQARNIDGDSLSIHISI